MSPGDTGRRGRRRELLLALPLGVVALAMLWFGDSRLSRRDWVLGSVIFAAGLVVTFFTLRQLRRAGIIR